MPYTAPILANIGIPMIFPQVILMGMAFIPVMLLEALILRKSLTLPWKKSLSGAATANLLTTIIGVPLAWAFMLIIQLLTTGGFALGSESPAKMLAACARRLASWAAAAEHVVICFVSHATS